MTSNRSSFIKTCAYFILIIFGIVIFSNLGNAQTVSFQMTNFSQYWLDLDSMDNVTGWTASGISTLPVLNTTDCVRAFCLQHSYFSNTTNDFIAKTFNLSRNLSILPEVGYFIRANQSLNTSQTKLQWRLQNNSVNQDFRSLFTTDPYQNWSRRFFTITSNNTLSLGNLTGVNAQRLYPNRDGAGSNYTYWLDNFYMVQNSTLGVTNGTFDEKYGTWFMANNTFNAVSFSSYGPGLFTYGGYSNSDKIYTVTVDENPTGPQNYNVAWVIFDVNYSTHVDLSSFYYTFQREDGTFTLKRRNLGGSIGDPNDTILVNIINDTRVPYNYTKTFRIYKIGNFISLNVNNYTILEYMDNSSNALNNNTIGIRATGVTNAYISEVNVSNDIINWIDYGRSENISYVTNLSRTVLYDVGFYNNSGNQVSIAKSMTNLSILNATNLLVWYSNGSTKFNNTITSNNGSFNISLGTTDSNLYVLNNFLNLSESGPRQNSPIYFYNVSSVSKTIRNNLTGSITTAVIVSTPSNCASVSKITYTPANGGTTTWRNSQAQAVCVNLTTTGQQLIIDPTGGGSDNLLTFFTEYTCSLNESFIYQLVAVFMVLLVLGFVIFIFYQKGQIKEVNLKVIIIAFIAAAVGLVLIQSVTDSIAQFCS